MTRVASVDFSVERASADLQVGSNERLRRHSHVSELYLTACNLM